MSRSQFELRKKAREAAEILGDDYKFTRDPELAAERAKARRERRAKGRSVRFIMCAIRGCQSDIVDHHSLRVCFEHANEIWEAVEALDQDSYMADCIRIERERRDKVRADSLKAAAAEATAEIRKPQAMGDIYFVRVTGLIKVGWSSNLPARIRAYGPTAEVLVHYPGTKRDEAALHRQLTPARASGREWYTDGDVIAMFVKQLIEKHGEPAFKAVPWTQHDGATVKVRNYR